LVKGEFMNEQIYTSMIRDIASQNANLTIEKAEFKARLQATVSELEQVKSQLEQYQNVLASDSDLNDLFNEAAQKGAANE
jgi:hypothetical protein